MVYGGYTYLEPDYEPKKDDIIVLFWMSGRKKIERLAEAVAAESSVGTFTKIKTMNDYVFKHYRAHVFDIIKVTDNSGFVKMAYPYQHFDAKNLIQFEASVIGNIFGMLELDELYVCDISFPEVYQKVFKGPLGMEEIRKYVGTEKNRRPHVGTIVKPKVGLAPKEFAHVAGEAWTGGLDLVKDDENLVDQDFCPWKERFDHTYKALDKAEKETGEKKLYATNVSDVDIDRMLERLDYIVEAGAKMVMIDVFVLGTPAVKTMVDAAHKKGLFVHAHRAGYAALNRSGYGISFQVLAKFYRMLGVDQLHVGTGVGKMDGSPHQIRRFARTVKEHKLADELALGGLEMVYRKDIGPTFPVASGGLHPGLVEGICEIFGTDVVIQAGGGVHGHPKGTRVGAQALRRAVEVAAAGKSLVEESKKFEPLKEALKTFGYIPRERVRECLSFFDSNTKHFEQMVLKDGMKALRVIENSIEPRND